MGTWGFNILQDDTTNRPLKRLPEIRDDVSTGNRGVRFNERRQLPDFAALPPTGGDSTRGISEDRNRQ